MIAARRALLVCALCLAPLAAAAVEPDAEGAKDHPLLTRMPGFYISRTEPKEFEAHTFKNASGADQVVEGRYSFLLYALQPGAAEPSRVQIQRNYENAIRKIGGKLLFKTDDGDLYLTVARDGKELWIHLNAYITTEYSLAIVEKAAMVQAVVADAAAFASDLEASGHAAVYGIYFDTGKSALKPASEAALAEIGKLLQSKPALKLHVVGHTDDAGALEPNLKLSQARAEAVVQALLGRGVAAARLRPAGVGPLAPVASNASEEGRAKNRRVELVKQ